MTGVRVEHVITSGTFSLDGGTWNVDNNVWIVGDDHEAVVIDAAHDAEAIARAVGDRRLTAIVRTPSQVLRESRRKESRDKRARVLHTLDDLLTRGEPVTFTAVAKAAGVSNWLVYAPGVREHIEAART